MSFFNAGVFVVLRDFLVVLVLCSLRPVFDLRSVFEMNTREESFVRGVQLKPLRSHEVNRSMNVSQRNSFLISTDDSS